MTTTPTVKQSSPKPDTSSRALNETIHAYWYLGEHLEDLTHAFTGGTLKDLPEHVIENAISRIKDVQNGLNVLQMLYLNETD